MTTPLPSSPRPVNIARRLNASMQALLETRGTPTAAEFSPEHNAMIVHYADGPVVVQPLEIRPV